MAQMQNLGTLPERKSPLAGVIKAGIEGYLVGHQHAQERQLKQQEMGLKQREVGAQEKGVGIQQNTLLTNALEKAKQAMGQVPIESQSKGWDAFKPVLDQIDPGVDHTSMIEMLKQTPINPENKGTDINFITQETLAKETAQRQAQQQYPTPSETGQQIKNVNALYPGFMGIGLSKEGVQRRNEIRGGLGKNLPSQSVAEFTKKAKAKGLSDAEIIKYLQDKGM